MSTQNYINYQLGGKTFKLSNLTVGMLREIKSHIRSLKIKRLQELNDKNLIPPGTLSDMIKVLVNEEINFTDIGAFLATEEGIPFLFWVLAKRNHEGLEVEEVEDLLEFGKPMKELVDVVTNMVLSKLEESSDNSGNSNDSKKKEK